MAEYVVLVGVMGFSGWGNNGYRSRGILKKNFQFETPLKLEMELDVGLDFKVYVVGIGENPKQNVIETHITADQWNTLVPKQAELESEGWEIGSHPGTDSILRVTTIFWLL